MPSLDPERLRGSIPALVTPFQDGAVDLDAYARLVEWHIGEGSHALVPCGTTAESPVLSVQEKEALIRTCVETAKGRVPVIAGTGGNNTASVIEATKRAEALGADAALVVTPYYNKPSQAGCVAHFTAVHEATSLPIVLYNVPGRTNVDLGVAAVAALAKLPRIVGIKDATGDLMRVSQTRHEAGPAFRQISGEDGTALGFNAHGGMGCISVTANVAPKLCAQLQETTLAGDYAGALALQDALLPLHEALFCEPSPAPAKYAMSALGLIRDEVRLPLIPATPAARERLDAALAHAGLSAPQR